MTDMATAMFQGFSDPDRNYVDLPLDLIAALPIIDTLAEMKVVLYVLRHTWGYREYDEGKRITLDEFMNGRKRRDGTRIDNGLGMSKNSILSGIDRAVDHGFMKVETDDSDKARIEKYYSLRMFKDCTPEVQSLNIGGSEIEPRSEIDTLDKDSRSNTSFFAKVAKQEGYALYLFNEKDKLLCTVSFKSILELPGNTHDWTSIVGSQIDVKRFGEYTLTDIVPTPAPYNPPLKEESEPTPPSSAAPPAPVEPTIPTGYEWWFAGDKANERHLLWIGKGRPLCGLTSWRNTNKWNASLQGHVPCPACVQIANAPKPVPPQFTTDEKNEMAVLCYGSVDAWKDRRNASAMMGALKRIKVLSPGANEQTLKAFGRDWNENDFRGKKGQRPKPHQVADEWMAFKERVQTEVVNGGHTGNSQPDKPKSAILW